MGLIYFMKILVMFVLLDYLFTPFSRLVSKVFSVVIVPVICTIFTSGIYQLVTLSNNPSPTSVSEV